MRGFAAPSAWSRQSGDREAEAPLSGGGAGGGRLRQRRRPHLGDPPSAEPRRASRRQVAAAKGDSRRLAGHRRSHRSNAGAVGSALARARRTGKPPRMAGHPTTIRTPRQGAVAAGATGSGNGNTGGSTSGSVLRCTYAAIPDSLKRSIFWELATKAQALPFTRKDLATFTAAASPLLPKQSISLRPISDG